MHLYTQSRELVSMQSRCRIISNLPHIPRPQSPHRTRRHRRRHLPPRQNIRRPKRHLRPALWIFQHRNNRVRSVQPHPNQIYSRPSFHPTSIIPFISIVSHESKVRPRLTHSPRNQETVIPSEARYSVPSRVFCAIDLPSATASPLFYVIASSLRRFYRNPVVLPITTPQTTSIPKLTKLKIPAATPLKSIRGTPAI